MDIIIPKSCLSELKMTKHDAQELIREALLIECPILDNPPASTINVEEIKIKEVKKDETSKDDAIIWHIQVGILLGLYKVLGRTPWFIGHQFISRTIVISWA